jgi:hypothetical protein
MDSNATRSVLARRTFLVGGGATLGSLIAANVFGQPGFATQSGDHHLLEQLSRELGQAAGIAELGSEYLRQFPAEGKRDHLIQTVLQSLSPSAERIELRSDETPKLTQLLLKKVAHDFEVSNTVVLSGWVLSRTEARVIAIASMANR